MKRLYVLLFVLLLVASAGLNSCKSKTGKSDQKTINSDQVSEMNKEIEEAVYPLPTSADVIKMLTELEVGYIIGITNPTSNYDKYLITKTKALNMGIYGADLSYATLYNMEQDVINYMEVLRNLSNDLNMGQLYNEKVFDQIKNSYDNKDKLVSILTGSFNNTYNYLTENDQQPEALMVVAGAWVEGMYITTHISEQVFHVEGIARVLLEQKRSFELFLKIAEPYRDESMVSEILDTLEPMKNIYEGLDTSLTLKNVEDITATISDIRDKLVS